MNKQIPTYNGQPLTALAEQVVQQEDGNSITIVQWYIMLPNSSVLSMMLPKGSTVHLTSKTDQ